MAVTISVWEKNGLKRGKALMDAGFMQEVRPSDDPKVSYGIRRWRAVSFTGGGPLSGVDPTYRITLLPGTTQGTIRVGAPVHQAAEFNVRDGETHEVWLPHT